MTSTLAVATTHDRSSPPPNVSRPRVAYMMSRFPKITETFVLREMIELEKLGYDVEVFPLRREKTATVQPDAAPFVQRACFTPVLSLAIALANVRMFCARPAGYLLTLWTLVRANFGSRRYLAGAMIYFPKAVYLASRMRRAGITHLHAHFASHPAAVAYVVGRLGGIPYSFTAHGSDLHRDQHMLREKTAGASFVVAISDYNRDMIVDVCGRQFADKIRVVHCGIDPQRFPARAEPTPFDCGTGPFKIVCIGTLHEVKGQTFLIEACRLLLQRGIRPSCHLLGGGQDLAKLQQQTRQAGLADHVTFHGVATSDEVQRHLADADVVVTPSVPSRDGRREGIPVVLMEAMASGVPCISTRLSGIPELVADGRTGFLTEPGDSAAIADALARLAHDRDLRERFGRASVEVVMRDFHLAKNTELLSQLFPVQSERL